MISVVIRSALLRAHRVHVDDARHEDLPSAWNRPVAGLGRSPGELVQGRTGDLGSLPIRFAGSRPSRINAGSSRRQVQASGDLI